MSKEKETKPSQKDEQTPVIPGNGRRKHKHWEVTILYRDGKKFARVYIDKKRAERFAQRQRKSPVVRSAKVSEVH